MSPRIQLKHVLELILTLFWSSRYVEVGWIMIYLSILNHDLPMLSYDLYGVYFCKNICLPSKVVIYDLLLAKQPFKHNFLDASNLCFWNV